MMTIHEEKSLTESQSSFSFRFVMSEELFKSLQYDTQHIYTRLCENKLRSQLFLVSALIVVLAVIYLGVKLSFDIREDPQLYWAGIVLILAVPLNWYINRSYMHAYSNMLLRQHITCVNVPQHIEVSECAIRSESQIMSVELKWQAISYIFISDQFFLFFCANVIVYLPKKSIQSEADKSIEDLILFIEKVSGKQVIDLVERPLSHDFG